MEQTDYDRGVVEGFYGKPWSAAARLRFIDFMSYAGFNSYIYAPKADPFHRKRWRTPYTAVARKHLVAAINKCGKKNINFCWALSPGLSIRYSERKDFDALADKFVSISDYGVRSFALFLDDIPPVLSHVSDRNKWSSLASAQADLVNRLADVLLERVPGARLLFCPTEYIGVKPTPYLETIGKDISRSIEIFWTGPLVVSPRITTEDTKSIAGIIKRKPLLWDNYPVNDYNRCKLNLGPIAGREPDVPSMLAGYYANPMNEAAASAIPLLTIAQWLRSPHDYDPRAALAQATVAPWGQKLSAGDRDLLLEFCALHPASFFFGEPPSPTVSAIDAAGNGELHKLKNVLQQFIELPALLKEADALRLFYNDVRPLAKETAKYCKIALRAVEAAVAEDGPALKAAVIKARAALCGRKVNTIPAAVVPVMSYIGR